MSGTKLIASNKTVINTTKVDIKDMSFNTGIRSSMSSKSFHYEKNMITDWFYDTFPETKGK